MERILIDGLSFAIPLFVMAIGGIYSEKSGVTNLALEGLQGMGAFIGAFVAVLAAGYFGSNSQVPYYLAIVCAMAGGMLYSLLYGLLCIRLKANQIIGGVVINILAMSLTAFFTKLLNRLVFGAASEKFVLGVSARFTIPLLSGIPVIGAAFKDVYPFEILILLIAVVAWYVLYKTRYGMNLRACGDNPHAVDAAGENVTRIRLIAVLVSGALSGLAGISFHFSELFFQHLCGIRISGDCSHDIRKLEDPSYTWILPAVWFCPIRRLLSCPEDADAQQLLGSCHDAALYRYNAAFDFLLKIQSCSSCTWRDLRQRKEVEHEYSFL